MSSSLTIPESSTKQMSHKISVAQSDLEWVNTVVQEIIFQATQAIRARGFHTLVLSGGHTPQPIFQELASPTYQTQLDWKKIYIFWGDERCVPPTDQDSNFFMAKTALLDRIAIPPNNVFRIRGEIQPEEAANVYQQDIDQFFIGREKRFDTILLGLGEDGHTASLFPNTNGLRESTRWVVPNMNPYSNTHRVTLTFPAINNSRNIIFLVNGANKAKVVADIIRNPNSPPQYPAKQITGKETQPHWILDSAAAKKI